MGSLQEIFELYEKDKSAILKDALIKRFEYTYEAVFNSIARYIKSVKSSSDAQLTFNQIIRYACDYGIIGSELSQWKIFKEKRNLTVHTYDANTALAIAAIIPDFLKEAKYFLKKLQDNNEFI